MPALPSSPVQTSTLPDYPLYVFYADGRIQNIRRGSFLKQNGPVDKRGYRKVSLRGTSRVRKTLRVHKLIALAFHGTPAPDLHADHINRDKLDNRAANLCWVSRSENAQNRSPNKTGRSK